MALPQLVVFDLDMCVWSPEMYELSEVPKKGVSEVRGDLGGGYGDGVVGVKSDGRVIKLFPGARQALQEFADGKYPGMRIAAASSADTSHAVKIGRTAMGMLEIKPGLTLRDTFAMGWPAGFEGNLQIGRSPPLSSNKAASHFPILKKACGIAYPGMLFFDDCNWGDHCAKVEAQCAGVVAQRTPSGMTADEWRAGLRKYAARYS